MTDMEHDGERLEAAIGKVRLDDPGLSRLSSTCSKLSCGDERLDERGVRRQLSSGEAASAWRTGWHEASSLTGFTSHRPGTEGARLVVAGLEALLKLRLARVDAVPDSLLLDESLRVGSHRLDRHGAGV